MTTHSAASGISLAQETKLGHISVSSAVDLNTMDISINSLSTLTNTHESEITALQNAGNSGLFSDAIDIKFNGYRSGTVNYPASTELTQLFGLIRMDWTDTYSPTWSLPIDDYMSVFTAGESGYFLIMMTLNFYDDSVSDKHFRFRFSQAGASANSGIFTLRGDFLQTSSGQKHFCLSGSHIVQMTANQQYEFAVASDNGGYLSTSMTNIQIIRITKNY